MERRDKRNYSRLGGIAASLSLLTTLGCAETPPPKTPREALERGQPMAALQMVRDGTPADKESVIRALLQKYDPIVAVEPVSDDELLARMDGPTVRQIRRLATVVRVTTKKKPIPYTIYWPSLSTSIAIEGPAGAVWRHGTNGHALSAFTGEDYPLAHSETEWKRGPGYDVKTPGDLILGFILFPVLILSSIPSSSTTTIPPTKEEILASAPHAARAEEALQGECKNDRCFSYYIFRKTADPAQALDLKIAVAVSSGGPDVGRAALSIPLPPGTTIEERIRAVGAPRRILGENNLAFATNGWGAGNYLCWDGSFINEEGNENASDSCKSVPLLKPRTALMPTTGLKLPERPPALGTMATSNAKKPQWAQSRYGYAWTNSLELPKADANADGVILSCETDVPRDKHGENASVVTIENQAVGEQRIISEYQRRSSIAFPLIRFVPNGSWSLLYKNDSGAKVATLVVQRKGAEIEASFTPAKAGGATCSLIDREGVEAAFASIWAKATDFADDMERKPVLLRLEENGYGFSRTSIRKFEDLIGEGASWVGWDDPRIADLVTRRDRQEKRFYQAVVDAFQELAKKPQKPDPQMRVHVDWVTYSCGTGHDCKLSMQMTNKGRDFEFPPPDMFVVFADGQFEHARRPFDRVAAGATVVGEGEFERRDKDAAPMGLVIQYKDKLEALPFRESTDGKP